MKFTLVFILGLLLINAQANDFMSLSEIDNNNFGNMILSTVHTHLETNAPIEQTISILQKVQKGVEAEQVAADKKNATDQARCEKESAEYRSAIANHKQVISTQQKLKETNEALLKQAKSDLAETNKNLVRNARQYSEESALRVKQAAQYKERTVHHKEAIAAVDSAVALISHLKTGSFIQLEKHFKSVQLLLEAHRDSHPLYGPIIETFAQLSSKADQEQLKKIIDLFGRLKKALQASQDTETATETQRIEDWAKRSSDLANEKKDLSANKARLTANIKGYQQIIASATNSIKSHKAQLAQALSDLQNLTKWCQAQARRYAKETPERAREVAILAKVIKHIQTKLAGMKSYLKKRINKF